MTAGGVITFNCGAGPVTIPVTATLNLPSTKNTVIDGGRKITLDGGGAVQIMRFDSANFQANDIGVTLQHIALVNGKTTPTEVIPTAPAPCSQGCNDGEGGALYMRDGYLIVIDSIFTSNQAAPLGPDTGGGAIYVLGSKGGVWIVGQHVHQQQAQQRGRGGRPVRGAQHLQQPVHGTTRRSATTRTTTTPASARRSTTARTRSARAATAAPSTATATTSNVILCGDAILNNAAGTNAFGGGLFFTSNNFGGTLTIADTTMTGNTGGHWTQAQTGSVTNAGTRRRHQLPEHHDHAARPSRACRDAAAFGAARLERLQVLRPGRPSGRPSGPATCVVSYVSTTASSVGGAAVVEVRRVLPDALAAAPCGTAWSRVRDA